MQRWIFFDITQQLQLICRCFYGIESKVQNIVIFDHWHRYVRFSILRSSKIIFPNKRYLNGRLKNCFALTIILFIIANTVWNEEKICAVKYINFPEFQNFPRTHQFCTYFFVISFFGNILLHNYNSNIWSHDDKWWEFNLENISTTSTSYTYKN